MNFKIFRCENSSLKTVEGKYIYACFKNSGLQFNRVLMSGLSFLFDLSIYEMMYYIVFEKVPNNSLSWVIFIVAPLTLHGYFKVVR